MKNKVKNGLSCISQFRNLGQNGTCVVYGICGGSEPKYTSGQKDFILGPRLEEGEGEVFSCFQGGQKNFKAA